MTLSIIKRYTKSFYQDSIEKKEEQNIYQDMHCLNNTIENSIDLQKIFKHQIINKKEGKEIIVQIFKKECSKRVIEYVEFLFYKKRLNLLQRIAIEYINIFQEDKGIVRVEITTSQELIEQQKKELQEQIKKKINKKNKKKKNIILIKEKIDTSIIGGVKIRIKNTIYDYSIKQQLKEIEKELMRG